MTSTLTIAIDESAQQGHVQDLQAVLGELTFANGGVRAPYGIQVDDLHKSGQEELLGSQLYGAMYAHQITLANGQLWMQPDEAGKARFRATLRARHEARRTVRTGYRLVKGNDSELTLAHGESTIVMTQAGAVDGATGDGSYRILDAAIASAPPAGWFMFSGLDDLPENVAGGILRVYWAITVAGATRLTDLVTTKLDEARIPFRMKISDDPQRFGRADAAVLYIGIRSWHRAAPLLAAIAGTMEPWLQAVVPRFTKKLAHGVGVAEDPGIPGSSFGSDRCKRLAAVLQRASKPAQSGKILLEEILHLLDDPRLTPGRMHLRPDSNRNYKFAEVSP